MPRNAGRLQSEGRKQGFRPEPWASACLVDIPKIPRAGAADQSARWSREGSSDAGGDANRAPDGEGQGGGDGAQGHLAPAAQEWVASREQRQ